MAQSVEHVLGKDEVTSSSLVISSKKLRTIRCGVFVFILEYCYLYNFNCRRVIFDNKNKSQLILSHIITPFAVTMLFYFV